MPQYELNLRDYLRIFRKRKVVIVVTFVLVSLSSIIFLTTGEKVYRSSALVKIEQRKTIAGLLTEMIVYSPGDVMTTESQFVSSFPVVLNVALRTGKLKDEWIHGLQGGGEIAYIEPEDVRPEYIEEVNQVVSDLQEKISVEIVTNTNMIRITADSPEPRDAMTVANTVATVYIEADLREKNKQAAHAREFIEDQLKNLETNLRKSEDEKLQHFGEGAEMVKLAAPIEDRLVELQFKLAELLQKYTDRHPQVIQLRDQIRSLESQIQGVSGKQLEYARLLREIEVNKKLFEMLKEKLEEARITEAQKVSDVSFVERGVLPERPVTGDRTLKIIMASFLGLVLGVALAFIFETMDTSIGTIEDVENVIKLQVLGVVPPIEWENRTYTLLNRLREQFAPPSKTDSEERFVHLFAHFKPQLPTTEAFRNIHTNLKLNSSKKAIIITSSGPREGKSTVTCNLGLVMAQIGLKTLLVSTDLRRPILAKMFGIKREPGVSELVRGVAGLDEVLYNITDILLGDLGFDQIRKTPGMENIWIMPSGRLPSNPVEVLESKAMGDIVNQLKGRFDVILFDTPPVLPVTDASLLAAKVDGVVIVYEIGRTGREGLMRTKVQLEAVGAKILGVVLNHTMPQAELVSPYPYYKKYKYYSKEDDKLARKKAGPGKS
ncbi:MAG: polysaccharide biosynthesis tyrosine autokinase [Candidatus Omnitrophica bacterium]|nr:polysaccharide biosynthesis tyrosine autokinase [Candidatus Omnitrophota bacterium]